MTTYRRVNKESVITPPVQYDDLDARRRTQSHSLSGHSMGDKSIIKSDSFLPKVMIVAAGSDILGGHSVQASALLHGLNEDGYDARFIPINPVFPRSFGWVRKIPYVRTLLNQLLYSIKLLDVRHVDVVHIFSASYWSFLLGPVPAMLAGRMFGKRIILHYHSGEAEDHLGNWGSRVHPWLKLAHVIVVPSIYLQRIFSRFGYCVRVIQNVVDISHFQYRQRTSLQPKILSTRNFEPYYRVDITIRAFAILRKIFPAAKLTLVGSGTEEKRLRDLAKQLAPGAVDFVGRVEPAYMPTICNQCDIFVNASIVDNQPVSILEAFAAGLPVISTKTGDIEFMLRDGENGISIPREDPAAMADAMKRLLENPNLAVQMTNRARKEVNRYTWTNVREEWQKLYCKTYTKDYQIARS